MNVFTKMIAAIAVLGTVACGGYTEPSTVSESSALQAGACGTPNVMKCDTSTGIVSMCDYDGEWVKTTCSYFAPGKCTYEVPGSGKRICGLTQN